MNERKQLYQQAYQVLSKITPLKFDCGRLCNKVCCQDETGESGMYLFPGEADLLKEESWLRITPTNFELSPGKPVQLGICNGSCNREQRPLACRVFPLTHYINYKGVITAEMDTRAYPLCPLARHADSHSLNQEFVRNVRKVGRMLSVDPEIKEFIEKLSRMLDEYAALPWQKLSDSSIP